MGMDSKLAAPKMYLMENDQLVSNGRIRSTYKVASPIELKGPIPDNDSLCSEYAFIRSLDCDIIKQVSLKFYVLRATRQCMTYI